LSRHFEKTLKQLNDTQEKRRATEATHLREAAALLQMDQKQGLPVNPPKMASFFQLQKSRPSSTAKPASKQQEPPPRDTRPRRTGILACRPISPHCSKAGSSQNGRPDAWLPWQF
jgi:hypothetical protein